MLTHVRRRTALEVLLVLVLIAATVIAVVEHQQPAQVATPRVGTGYVPPSTLWGFRATWFVSSPYTDEAGLLGYNQPVGDYDYGTGYGASRHIHLPGGSWDKYRYFGGLEVIGSGWIQEYAAPNGGRFAILHLRNLLGGPVHPVPQYCGAAAPSPGFDVTSLAALALGLPRTSGVTIVRGGTRIGWTGWPTCSQYAAGDPEPANAHECLVLTAKALHWFWLVATGQDKPPKPKPKPFNARGWNAWRVSHHKPLIPYKTNGKLTPIARAWQNGHQSCYGVTGKQVWHAKQGFEQEYFSRCISFEWPRKKGAPVKFVKRKA